MDNVSKTFCIYPWMHQMIETDGDVKLCCVAETPTTKVQGKHMNINRTKLSGIWNSEYMQDVRRRLLQGKQVSDCGNCYKRERRGEKSMRQFVNEASPHKVADILNTYDTPDSTNIVDTMPTYLDLRFGNLCNLRCRMCTGKYSHELGEEFESIRQDNAVWSEMFPETFSFPKYDWANDKEFWKDIEQYIPYIENIYLTGGEPTLVEGNYDFLNKLITEGVNHKVSLSFNTNVTNFQQRFLDVIDQFKHVRLSLSIDGTEGVQEYLRYPSKWKAVERNMKLLTDKLKESNSLYAISFTPSLNIINLANFPKYIDWAYDLATSNNLPNVLWDMAPIRVHGPEYLDLWHANPLYRDFCTMAYNDVDEKKVDFFKNLRPFFDETLDCIQNQFSDDAEGNLKTLSLFNAGIDKKRGTLIEDYIPYSQLIYEQ